MSMDYATLKLVHQGAVALSIAGFAARGLAALLHARWVRTRIARTLPHIVDTVLLASAIGLAWWLRLNPIDTPWLLAKIVGLLALHRTRHGGAAPGAATGGSRCGVRRGAAVLRADRRDGASQERRGLARVDLKARPHAATRPRR